MRKLFGMFVVAATAASSLFAQVADGDQHYAMRAEGHQGARAQATHIDAAITAYERALAQNTNDLEASWKLLRALRYKGTYVLTDNEQKKVLYAKAKKVGRKHARIALPIICRSPPHGRRSACAPPAGRATPGQRRSAAAPERPPADGRCAPD